MCGFAGGAGFKRFPRELAMTAVKFLMAMIAFLPSSAAVAEVDWTFITEDSGGISLYADKSSVRYRAEEGKNFFEIGVKVYFKIPESGGMYDGKYMRYTLSTYEVNCAARETREQAEQVHFVDGTVGRPVFRTSTEPWRREGTNTSPSGKWSMTNSSDVLHEILLKWACGSQS